MSFSFDVSAELAGKRLDAAIAAVDSRLSRARARRLIEQGHVTVGGAPAKPAHRLRLGERVEGRIPEPEPDRASAEDIPLDILYEDRDVVVVDKPAGLVVHPAAGHRTGTLVNALLHHCSELSGIGGVLRPGIVHRLDRNTSGVLVVAKSDEAHRHLGGQFKAHSVDREYLALVRGSPRAEAGSIDSPIGRHRSDPTRFTVRTVRPKRTAVTHWEVVERLGGEFTLLGVRLETGRTHQIRVHLASVGLPVAGDPVYGGGRRAARALGLRRQALHAARLAFAHPRTGERLSFSSPLPADLARVLQELRS